MLQIQQNVQLQALQTSVMPCRVWATLSCSGAVASMLQTV